MEKDVKLVSIPYQLSINGDKADKQHHQANQHQAKPTHTLTRQSTLSSTILERSFLSCLNVYCIYIEIVARLSGQQKLLCFIRNIVQLAKKRFSLYANLFKMNAID